jgi:hypothetical protein
MHVLAQGVRSCELAHASLLTPDSGWRNVRLLGLGWGSLEGTSLKHRFKAASVLLACLLGIFQPAFACASMHDCCPRATPSGCGEALRHADAGLEAPNCCATQALVTYSVSIIAQPRYALDHAYNPPATLPILAVLPVATDEIPSTHLTQTALRLDESLTYLHTARLRL